MRYHLSPLLIVVLLSILALAGCINADAGLSTGGDQTGEFGHADGAVALATSDYIELEIDSGELTALAEAPDLDGSRYRTSRILFRRVAGSDGRFLVSVFEVTQAQWQRLGGSNPWTSIPTAMSPNSSIGDGYPAYALSFDEIDATLSDYRRASGVDLELPTGEEWGEACDSGSKDYFWGDSDDRDVVRDYARTADSADGEDGPLTVGSLNPNDLGIYDIHGNLWEWCDDGTTIRGGSWHEATHAGRSGNAMTVDDARFDDFTDHALFGARLVLRP